MNFQQNQSRDHIDELLNKSMNGFQPDVPDHMWSEIAARLPKQRRRIVFFWYALAASLFVGMILVFLTINHAKTYPNYSSDKQEDVQKAKTKVESNPNKKAEDPFILKQSSTFTSNSDIGPSNNNRMIKHSNNKMESSQLLKDNALNLIVHDPLTFQNDPINADYFENNNDKLLQIKWNELAIELPKLNLQILAQDNLSITPKHEKVISKTWIGGQFACFNIDHSSSKNTQSISHIGKMGVESGIQIQMDYGRHWRFGMGLAYQQYYTTLNHNTTLRLKDAIPINPSDPGLKNYAFNYEYNTPIGRSSIHIQMSEQDHPSSMPLDEPFVIAMRTDQKVQSWVLPLNAQRLFGKRKLQYSFNTGALISYHSRVTNTVVHYSELCQDLCFSSEKTPVFNTIPIKRILLEGTLGVGLAYYLKPRIRIHISPEISYGIHGFQKMGIQSGIFFNINKPTIHLK
ncbi:MAG TPA: hypothetical protein PLD02_01885 [Saprospiraceae bacterium]|nr:hypothetical protein [Saprospiraceae bacterium]